MKTNLFSSVRRILILCIVVLVVCSTSSCLSPIDMFVSSLIEKKTNEAVKEAVEPVLNDYSAQTNAYASSVASIDPSLYSMYENGYSLFLVGKTQLGIHE